MRQRREKSPRRSLTTIGLVLALAGCAASVDSAPVDPGNAASPELLYIGTAHLATPEETAAYDAQLALPLALDELEHMAPAEGEEGLREGRSPWVMIDPESGEMFEELLGADDLAAIEEAKPGGVRDMPGSLSDESVGEIQGSTSELIRGADDRQARSSFNGFNMRAYPWRAVGALAFVGQRSSDRSVDCTATKVGPRLLLTAGHCVWNRDNDSLMRRRWRPGADGLAQLDGDSVVPNGIKRVVRYFVHDNYIRWGGAWNDWALLVLEDSRDTVGLGWFGRKVDHALLNDTVHNLGFPAIGQRCAGAPAAAGGRCFGSMYHNRCRVTNTTARTVYYNCDTTGGHSGGPIYKFESGNRKIIAAVSGSSAGLNLGARMTNTLYDAISLRNAQFPSEF